MTRASGRARTATIAYGDEVRCRIPARAPIGSYWIVQSAPVEAMTVASHEQFVADLNAWTHRGYLQRLVVAHAILAVVAVAAATHAVAPVAVALLVSLAAFVAARTFEMSYRQYHLAYDLPAHIKMQYEVAGRGLSALSTSALIESIHMEHLHGDWKRHAGANVSVHSDVALIDRGYPRYLSSNLSTPPVRLRAQRKTLCFLPDRLLLEEGGQFASLGYDHLHVSVTPTSIRWHSRVPPDAECLGHSWHKVNKDGTRDRRFKDNRQIPILLFAEFTLSSPSGLQIALHVSNKEAACLGAAGIAALKAVGRTIPARSFESARLLAAASTWRDITFQDFFDALGRDAGKLQGSGRTVLPRLLGGMREVMTDFDACTTRTLRGLPPEESTAIGSALGDVRRIILRTVSTALGQAAQQLEAAPPEWQRTRAFVLAVRDEPERVLDFETTQLGLPSDAADGDLQSE